jgi:hypothetical protein
LKINLESFTRSFQNLFGNKMRNPRRIILEHRDSGERAYMTYHGDPGLLKRAIGEDYRLKVCTVPADVAEWKSGRQRADFPTRETQAGLGAALGIVRGRHCEYDLNESPVVQGMVARGVRFVSSADIPSEEFAIPDVPGIEGTATRISRKEAGDFFSRAGQNRVESGAFVGSCMI